MKGFDKKFTDYCIPFGNRSWCWFRCKLWDTEINKTKWGWRRWGDNENKQISRQRQHFKWSSIRWICLHGCAVHPFVYPSLYGQSTLLQIRINLSEWRYWAFLFFFFWSLLFFINIIESCITKVPVIDSLVLI